MLICNIIAILLAAATIYFEFKRDLTMLQQNSYRNERYTRWLSTSQDTTSVMRLVSGAAALAALSTLSVPLVTVGLVAIVSIVNIFKLAGMEYKKPLVMTKRATRNFCTMSALAVAVLAFTMWICMANNHSLDIVAVAALLIYCFSHVFTLLANALLKPIEKHINDRYYNEAKSIISSIPELTIVGVTGSYGKTSTKHYLHRILSEKYDVLMTPGSFNTTLGVIRTIRENLKPYNDVFIVEMGAKQPGDIKEICDLVHPTIGIVTAVGEQHLESFKTIENVQRTKFELVDSLPADGLAVINNDFPYVANRKVENVKCLRYTINGKCSADYHAHDISYSRNGTSFSILTPEGECLPFTTRLVGECNVSNLMTAIIVALRLQIPVDKIRYAIAGIEQVEHRLNMKHTPGGITIIDDAFNSNPTGSGMALDVLKMMTGGRRIIVTPGMIELGDRQAELNKAFGAKIASCADIAVVVGEYNRDAIVSGIESAGNDGPELKTVDSFNEAQQFLATTLRPGDTILYENDLPDTFK